MPKLKCELTECIHNESTPRDDYGYCMNDEIYLDEINLENSDYGNTLSCEEFERE